MWSTANNKCKGTLIVALRRARPGSKWPQARKSPPEIAHIYSHSNMHEYFMCYTTVKSASFPTSYFIRWVFGSPSLADCVPPRIRVCLCESPTHVYVCRRCCVWSQQQIDLGESDLALSEWVYRASSACKGGKTLQGKQTMFSAGGNVDGDFNDQNESVEKILAFLVVETGFQSENFCPKREASTFWSAPYASRHHFLAKHLWTFCDGSQWWQSLLGTFDYCNRHRVEQGNDGACYS